MRVKANRTRKSRTAVKGIECGHEHKAAKKKKSTNLSCLVCEFDCPNRLMLYRIQISWEILCVLYLQDNDCGRIRVVTSIKSSSIVQCSPRDSKNQRVDTRIVSTPVLHCVSLECDRKPCSIHIKRYGNTWNKKFHSLRV